MHYAWKTSTAIAAALMLQAGFAFAEGDKTSELPKEGNVTRIGTVQRIVDENTFILLDQQTGQTVDVHTVNNLSLKEGTRVRVKGTADSDVLGMGHEIVNATVASVNAGVGGPLEPITNDQNGSSMDMGNEMMRDSGPSRDSGSSY